MNKIWIFMILALLFMPSVSANTFDNETFFHVQNEIYTANTTMTFDVIAVDIDYFTFNVSSFFLKSANDINISYDFIRYDIPTAHMNEKVMSFYVNTTSAAATFRISGFQPNTKYKVYKNGVLKHTPTSTLTGYIMFTDAGWGTPEPYIEIYEFMYGEAPIVEQHDMKPIGFLALLPLGFVFWKSGIIFFKRKKKHEIV